MVNESIKDSIRKYNGVNERSDSLEFNWLIWLHWLLDGGAICLLKSHSCRSKGIDENFTSYMGYSS